MLYKPVTEEAAKRRIAGGRCHVEPRAPPGVPGSGAGSGGYHAAGYAQAGWHSARPFRNRHGRSDGRTADCGCPLAFHFQLPDGALEVEAHGQVAWANPNGQTGVHFIDVGEKISTELKKWLKAAATNLGADADETVPHCKLTDLSLGGCYVQTDAPFPERALVDLCLKTNEMEVHTEGMVRVTHPEHGMGVEFPSRTSEQRAQVGNLISFLQSSPRARCRN